MGTWGTGLFSDDFAADLRDEFRDLIAEGFSSTAAVDNLLTEYSSSMSDIDEEPVFWLALATVQWKLGRLEERTLQNAIQVIDSGRDLERWDDSKNRKKREAVLQKVRTQLLSSPPTPKHLPRTIKSANEWKIGEIIGFRLVSQNWVLMRVIGHHADKGGRFAVCELLDWIGESFPPPKVIKSLPIRRETSARRISQFLFQESRTKKEQARVLRLGIICSPAQKCRGYTVFVWPYIDRLLKEIFNLE